MMIKAQYWAFLFAHHLWCIINDRALGGLNTFQYAPNPVEWVDPWGLKKRKCITAGQSKRRRLRKLLENIQDKKKKGYNFTEFKNKNHKLPKHNSDGTLAKYTEHDYNPESTPSQRKNGAHRGKKELLYQMMVQLIIPMIIIIVLRELSYEYAKRFEY